MEKLDKHYWQQRYEEGSTGWDTGAVTTPIKEYVDQLKDKKIRILIPGCGNGYEAQYVYEQGFENVHVLDFAQQPLDDLLLRNPAFPQAHLHREDFFEHQGEYDLILEQTFFCALDPALRENYVVKMKSLLSEKGKLAGVLFNRDFKDGPPFGGTAEEYQQLFSAHFKNVSIAPCYNSIEPRQGTEVFIRIKQ